MTNANDPINLGSESDKCGNPIKEHLGLTKREYFAAMAMQGVLANNSDGNTNWDYDIIGEHCTKAADALITALNKTPNE